MMELEKVIAFAKEQGYETAEPLGKWKGFNCYEPILDPDHTAFTGLPLLILVEPDGKIRMSTPEEALAQLNDD